jgi:hypothetical protein
MTAAVVPSAATPLTTMLDYALAYARRGWPVFPLGVRSKLPLLSKADGGNGCLDAVTDEAQIRAWWEKSPQSNIGIATGRAFWVLDIDSKHGDAAAWVETAELPATIVAITGSGGRHYLFARPDFVVRNSVSRIGPHIDVRGVSGYIVGPPSIHPDTGRCYEWDAPGELPEEPLAAAPDWLLGAMRAQRDEAKEPLSVGEVIPKGKQHDTIFKAGCSLRSKFSMGFDEMLPTLLALNRRCEEPAPERNIEKIARSACQFPPGVSIEYQAAKREADLWPDPLPLPNALPPVLPFNPDLLPGAFRDLAEHISRVMSVPLDLPAVGLMVTLAGAVNRRATIRPKRLDDWTVVLNLWGAIVAPPGYKKSPILSACTGPLQALEGEMRRALEADRAAYDLEAEEAELRVSAWREEAKKAAKKGAALPERPSANPTPPQERRLIVSDATVEKLHEVMGENPAGLFCWRDELTGWFAQLDKQGRETERGFVLTSWNGNDGYGIDRIGRGSVYAEHVCLSILGGIQPGRLRAYMADTLADGPGNDGLMQRFQMVCYPDFSADYDYADERPNRAAIAAVEERLRGLAELSPDSPIELRFDDAAQRLFVEWYTDCERRARRPGEHPAFASHLSKFGSLMPKLAGLIHLGEGETGELVGLDSARRAAAWCDYLESHARRVYSAALTPETLAALALAEKIQSGRAVLDGVLTVRDVYQKRWQGLDTPEAVKAAVDVLADHDWLRQIPGDGGAQGGRPSLRYEANPKVIG